MNNRRLQNLIMAAAIAALLAIAACSSNGGEQPPAPTGEPTAQQGTPLAATNTPEGVQGIQSGPGPVGVPSETDLTIEDLVALLESAGIELEEVEIDNSSPYKPLPRAYFTVGRGFVSITKYPSHKFAIAEAASERFDVQQGQRMSYGWDGDPPTERTHVFVVEDMMVTYLGDNPVALDVLVSAGGKLMAGGDNGAMAHGTPRITAYLESRGHEVTLPNTAPNDLGIGLFGRRGETILVNGQPLHIFDFRPTRGTNDFLRAISDDGYTLPNFANEPERVEWELPPRIYATAHVLAIYVGDDPDVIDALRVLGGKPVKGVMEDQPYPFDIEWLVESLNEAGAEAERAGEGAITVNGERVMVRVLPADDELELLERALLTGSLDHQPHMFSRENIEALYIGEDESVLTALRSVLGWVDNGPDKMVVMGLADHLPQEPAPVRSMVVYKSQNNPTAYTARIVTESGGCDHFYGASFERNGTDIKITVINYSIQGACWDFLRTHTHYVFLGNDFEPDVEYTLTVNGLTDPEFRKTFVAK